MVKKKTIEAAKGLLKFIKQSPTAYHVVDNISQQLLKNGWEKVDEDDVWGELSEGGRYFVTRNDSSLIAFIMPRNQTIPSCAFNVFAAHTDSPSLKIKEYPEITSDGYVRLDVEEYGGTIRRSWIDTPLSIAGEVHYRTKNGIVESKLFDFCAPIAIIPSLAIHMDKKVNSEGAVNVHNQLYPLVSASGDFDLKQKLSQCTDIDQDSILGFDAFLYPVQEGVLLGHDMIVSPRLDDLACVYAGVEALTKTTEKTIKSSSHIPMLALFDNEEVGSRTQRGAASTFMKDVLERICDNMGMSLEEHKAALARSFMLSADNGHAKHPAATSKSDANNALKLNGGIAIKYAASQTYCTNGHSAAIVKMMCDEAEIPYQTFFNHSDERGGSTLGNIAMANVSIEGADVGLAQLAMHSSVETMGVKDPAYMVSLVRHFFEKAW